MIGKKEGRGNNVGGDGKGGRGHDVGVDGKGGSGHNVGGDGKGVEFATSILMRGVSTERNSVVEGHVVYERNEFYRIDIKKVKGDVDITISANKCFDSLLDCFACGSKLVLAGRSRIYCLARALMMPDLDEIPDKVRGIHCLKSVSWIDLDEKPDPKQWKSGPPLKYYVFPLDYAALGHNIYNLSTGYMSVPCVLNTSSQHHEWALCTPDDRLSQLEVSPDVLADPANKRIIFQVSDLDETSPLIYSWEPEHDPPLWKFITGDIDVDSWTSNFPTLVHHDVIFFHSPNTFSAYHLEHKQWLRVTLSQSHPFPPHLACHHADHMFYLGHSNLCLVSYHRRLAAAPLSSDHPYDYVLGIIVFLDIFHIQLDKKDPLHFHAAHSFTKSLAFDDLYSAAEFLHLESYFED